MPVGQAPRTAPGYQSDFLAHGWGQAFADQLETVDALIWPESMRTYAKMRNDPQLQAVLNAYCLPIRQAPWHLDGRGCRDEVTQLVADDLGLPILGADEHPGPARRRGVHWEEHLRLALLHLVYGFMPFVQRYDILDGKARLAELSERMPHTVDRIDTDDSGRISGVLQFGEKAPIRGHHFVWYVREREGTAWQGRSMLRAAFGPWLLKHEMWRVLATSNRRFGMGVPNVEAPANATAAQILQAEALAQQIRVGDQGGAGLPHGFKLNLTGLTGSTPDTLQFIRYLDQQMAQMALVSVLNLDASPNGSRALGETFINMLLTSLRAVGRDMADTATRLAVQMVDYNWGVDEPAPRVVCGDVGARPESTAEAVTLLLNAGAVGPDPALEAWARQRWQLPEREIPRTDFDRPTAAGDAREDQPPASPPGDLPAPESDRAVTS
jgi:hypothetical protein